MSNRTEIEINEQIAKLQKELSEVRMKKAGDIIEQVAGGLHELNDMGLLTDHVQGAFTNKKGIFAPAQFIRKPKV